VVALVVSDGPPVTVPDVIGLTRSEASTAITGAGLIAGTITQTHSAIAVFGAVLSQIPAAGVPVSPGSTVALTVSEGPEPMTVTLPGGVPLDLVQIPGWTFTMGSPDSEQDRNSDEGPQHQVALTGYWMGVYVVTQAQWAAVMGGNPSYFQGANAGGVNTENRPVEQVSWNDCNTFLNALNAYVTTTGQGAATFRLPTEAEWEYACRAGTTTRFYWGDDPDYTAVGNYAWCYGNSGNQTHDVGLLLPNAWGLYDMNGNVWQWCQDWYGAYAAGAQTNPTGAASGSYRVQRGGSWNNFFYLCRSAYRSSPPPADAYDLNGFRVARTP
jgi:formylglycine-generating enzyme required for sulfatase activity